MPNLISQLINPRYSTSYPGREKLLSSIAGRGQQRPPAMLQAPSTAMPQPKEYAWQKDAQEIEEKRNIKNALDEIVSTRNKSGKPFLSETQRLQIFSKYGIPAQIASQFNATISREQEKAKPKYRSVTRPTAEGGSTTGLETEEYLKGHPVETLPTRKEKALRKLEAGTKWEDLSELEKAASGIKTDKKGWGPLTKGTQGGTWQEGPEGQRIRRAAPPSADKGMTLAQRIAVNKGRRENRETKLEEWKFYNPKPARDDYSKLFKSKDKEDKAYDKDLKAWESEETKVKKQIDEEYNRDILGGLSGETSGKKTDLQNLMREAGVGETPVGQGKTTPVLPSKTQPTRTGLTKRKRVGTTGAWEAKTGMPKMTAAKQGIVDTESFKATGTLIAKGIDKSHDAVKATEKYVLDTGIELSKEVFNTLVWWVKKAAESQKAAREETFR